MALLVALLPATAATAAATAAAAGIDVVRAGETLSDIAIAHGVTTRALMTANGIANPNRIYSGQRLVIPGSRAPGPAHRRPAPPGAPASSSASHSRPAGSTRTAPSPIRGAAPPAAPAGARTITGNFAVRSKLSCWPMAHAGASGCPTGWASIGPAAHENGIHGLPISAKTGYKDWGNQIGTPISFGCVVLSDAAAARLFSVAYIGMPVRIIP